MAEAAGDLVRHFRRKKDPVRVGDHRIVDTIDDDALLIVVVAFGHRRLSRGRQPVVCSAPWAATAEGGPRVGGMPRPPLGRGTREKGDHALTCDNPREIRPAATLSAVTATSV
ncbi:MAG: type II toxin-antitoxin system RelE family toxin [Acidimicrobiales bacterium]|jgi:hypothetical protein